MRDGFTTPQQDFDPIGVPKRRPVLLHHPAKQRELRRAGLPVC